MCMRHTSMHLMLWWALACPSTDTLMCAIYTSTKHCRCSKHEALLHSCCENMAPLSTYSHSKSFVRYDALKVKRCQISTTKIRWNAFGFPLWKFGNNSKMYHWSMNQDHTFSKSKSQSPISLKLRKLMPRARF